MLCFAHNFNDDEMASQIIENTLVILEIWTFGKQMFL